MDSTDLDWLQFRDEPDSLGFGLVISGGEKRFFLASLDTGDLDLLNLDLELDLDDEERCLDDDVGDLDLERDFRFLDLEEVDDLKQVGKSEKLILKKHKTLN